MAYNQSYNPDRLPAFAEPERPQNRTPATQALPPRNKPPPPLPHAQQLPPKRISTGAPNLTSNYQHPSVSRVPASPTSTTNGDNSVLWTLFTTVDKDGSGKLTEKELRQALVNGDWSSFDPCTVTMMIRLFDTNRSGSIDYEEFCGLWSFLASWRSLFDRFDSDKSGNISINEYTNALIAFGYRLSSHFVHTLFNTFDKKGTGAISFDLFVQSFITLKRMTDVFKKYDDDRDGYITMSFEDFLTEILKQR